MEPAKIIKLRRPIEFGRETIEELQFRRGRLGDLKGIKISTEIAVDDIMLIASRMSGLVLPAIQKLDEEDAGEVAEHVLGFYERCLQAGSKRSEP